MPKSNEQPIPVASVILMTDESIQHEKQMQKLAESRERIQKLQANNKWLQSEIRKRSHSREFSNG